MWTNLAYGGIFKPFILLSFLSKILLQHGAGMVGENATAVFRVIFKRLPPKTFVVAAGDQGPRDIELSIEYVNTESGMPIFVKDGIEVTYIPDILTE